MLAPLTTDRKKVESAHFVLRKGKIVYLDTHQLYEWAQTKSRDLQIDVLLNLKTDPK